MIINSKPLINKTKSISKKRCFYLYHKYDNGTFDYKFCLIHGLVQNFYLKRHGKKKGKRYWSVISYKTKEEFGPSKIFSVELDKCIEQNLVEMIERVFTKYEVDLSIVPSKQELQFYEWTG